MPPKMKIFLFIIIFFLLGALLIISNHNLSFICGENVSLFSDLYMGWLNKVYSNAYSMTGKIVQLEWLPKR